LCLLTRSDCYRQYVFGEHSSLSAINSLFKTRLNICQTGFHTDWYHEVLRLVYCHAVSLYSPMVHTQLTIIFKYEENVLEIMSKCTYLGIVFTTGGYFNTFFEMLAGQALKAIF